jgi:hypothetical protein
MKRVWALVSAAVLLAVPLVASGDVIDIAQVNADNADGTPVLQSQLVIVEGVVTIGTRALAWNTDIYIQDATGGVNVYQSPGASPVVAPGDSVRVTGVVGAVRSAGTNSYRTFIRAENSVHPAGRIEVLNRGNPLPEPVAVTPRDLASSSGEDLEGTYVVLAGVSRIDPEEWHAGSCTEDRAVEIADGDTTCWLWIDADTDLCGSPPPHAPFDVYGVVVPSLRNDQSTWLGHGILPPARSNIQSRGGGSGFAEIEQASVFAEQTVTLTFTLEGEADELVLVAVPIPEGWTFSGDAGDVSLDGGAFAEAVVASGSVSPDGFTVEGASLLHGVTGTITIGNLGTPATTGPSTFEISTAVDGGEPLRIEAPPSVDVWLFAPAGSVLINEVYPDDDDARAEFIELRNPTEADIVITGWVLTDIDGSGKCGGANLWRFPDGASIPAGARIVIAKDTNLLGEGFQPAFGQLPDYELVDLGNFLDRRFGDSPSVPNLTLVSPADANDNTTQEILLLGGSQGNGASLLGVAAYEAVYLYSDQTLMNLVDAMEYRDPTIWDADACASLPGLGGPDDAWTPGPPPKNYSLCRDESALETNASDIDFILSSSPTPGAANIIEDTLPPGVSLGDAGSSFLLVRFTEPVAREEAESPGNYVLSRDLAVRDAWLSIGERTVVVKTDGVLADTTYTLTVSGISDLAGNPMAEVALQFHGPEVTIAEIQAWDERGISLLVGESAAAVGFTTVPPGIFQPDRTSMYIQDLEGWGLNVYSPNVMGSPPRYGDLVKAEGIIEDYVSSVDAGATTEISASSITVLARGFDIVQPTVLPTGDVGSEENEGRLVTASGIIVRLDGFAFYIDDGSGAVQVYQNFTNLDFSVFAVGDSVEVTGAVLQYDRTVPYFGGYELAPRYQSDMVALTAHYAANARVEAAARVLDIDSDDPIEITYNAPKATQISVRVYDLKGRAVVTLFDGMCLGPSRSTWDGRDDSGNKVPPGVYICHIQSRERTGGDGTDEAIPIVVGRKLK